MGRTFRQQFFRLFIGRREAYTQREIRTVPCCRCGKPSVHQWSVCANGNRQVGVCLDCDIELNRIALAFMRHPHAAELLAGYAAEAWADAKP